ncbi:MAG: peptidylprolyl isomerase [Ornithinimicrobium sp.]
MLSRRHPLALRHGVALATGCAMLALAGCSGSTQAPPLGDEPAQTQPQSELARSTGTVDCDPAPELPTDIPTFRATQAPSATVPDTAVVDVETNCGTITLDLNGAAAPQTVASFLLLAEGGFWADSPCHRLVDASIHVLQCGDPTGTGRGGPGYTFGIENAPPDGFYPRGAIAMARTADPDSNGSQFFIVFEDTMLPSEGGGYTIFGTVTDGMNIVDHVADAGVEGGGVEGMPAQPISIIGVGLKEEASTS